MRTVIPLMRNSTASLVGPFARVRRDGSTCVLRRLADRTTLNRSDALVPGTWLAAFESHHVIRAIAENKRF